MLFMLHAPSGTPRFQEGVEFAFPVHPCCNCGTESELHVIDQDTRRTFYMLAGGSETTFRLPLPFCPRCLPSARRRPKNIVHRLLLLVLTFAVWFTVFTAMGALDVMPPSWGSHLIPIAAMAAVLTAAGMILLSRPSDGQSSYFQPVRISILKREFLSGDVKAIGFSFTHHEYAQAFTVLNKDAISRKQLFVGLI